MGVNMMPPLAIERVPSMTRPTKPAAIRIRPRARAMNRNMMGLESLRCAGVRGAAGRRKALSAGRRRCDDLRPPRGAYTPLSAQRQRLRHASLPTCAFGVRWRGYHRGGCSYPSAAPDMRAVMSDGGVAEWLKAH